MTARGKARILMASSVLLLVASGGYAYLSAQKVARLRELQAATQAALQEAYRLMVQSNIVLHSRESIVRPFQDWKTSLRRNADNLQALAVQPGLKLLSPELSDRAAQVLRVWKAMETSNFKPVEQSLTQVLDSAASELGAQGVSAGREIALADEKLLVTYYLPMATAEKGLTTGIDALGPFVTNVLDSLGQQIGRQTDVALLQTTRVTAAAIVVLVVSVVAALLYSITFLDQANRSLEDTVRRRTRAIQSLLDFSGRGFLSFGPDFVIRPEHSRDCEAILGPDLTGKRLPDLLYAEGTAHGDFVKALELVFSGKSRPDVVFELIDNEVRVGDRLVQLDFRVIDAETLMCSLEDVTERKRLEAHVAEQQELREMVLRIAMNRRPFISLTREAEEVFQTVYALALNGSPAEPGRGPAPALSQGAAHASGGNGDGAVATARAGSVDGSTALQALHTFKANAAFLRMKRTAGEAHALEQNLQDRMLVEDAPDPRVGLESLIRAYRAEIDIVREHLGQDWIREPDTITVRRQQLLAVERLARTAHPDDLGLQTAIEAARMLPVGELLERYNETVQNLASSRAKRIKPITIVGGETLILPEHFDRIAGSIVHLLRNIVDHGIERPGERTAAGKDPEGRITIATKATGAGIEISLSDDGRGIPFEAVQAKARLLGIVAPSAVLGQRELIQIIFRPGFSTSETVSAVSGRGVGLTAVRETVRELGGRIGVSTRKGQGTTFTLSIPFKVMA